MPKFNQKCIPALADLLTVTHNTYEKVLWGGREQAFTLYNFIVKGIKTDTGKVER